MSFRLRLRSIKERGATLASRSSGSGGVTQRIHELEARLDLLPADSAERAPLLNDLGNRLRDRYLATGDTADLEAAIARYRDALDLGESAELTGFVRGNLAVALVNRYAALRELADLEAAIRFYREVIAASEPGSTDAVRHLSNLANALHERYYRIRDKADLDDAIEAAQRAMVDAVPGSREHAWWGRRPR
jgi:tetratricopeptide (TPR) repeat protein